MDEKRQLAAEWRRESRQASVQRRCATFKPRDFLSSESHVEREKDRSDGSLIEN